MYKRGDIYYVERSQFSQTVGSEQFSGRPAIIVSNDKNNEYSSTLEVVYLTTQPKTDLPTHVNIRSSSRVSTALCEQVTSVSVDRIGDYYGTCSEEEMNRIDTALSISLDIDCQSSNGQANDDEYESSECDDDIDYEELIKVTTERNLYKQLYEEMVERMVRK